MSLQVEIKKKVRGFSLDVDFVKSQGCLGILGASGCGKSMTLKCIAGIERPDWGRIVFNGRILFDSEKGIFEKPQKRRVGYLFQDFALFPNMTVEENVGSGIRLPKKEKRERTQEMIEKFALFGQEKKYPDQLSGGQKQRVALARILAYGPDLLLLDEPFTALDAYLKEQLQFQLQELLKSFQGETILVTHNRDEVYQLCEELLVLDGGKSVEMGLTREVFRKPQDYRTARLTGCKNISRARKVSEREVEAVDWGVRLVTEETVSEETAFVGIRAHSFRIPEKETRNLLSVSRCELLEAPFEMNVIFYGEEPGKKGIWWKLDKGEWLQKYGGTMPETLTVAPKDVLLLR